MLCYLLIVSSSGLLFYKREFFKISNFQPTITASLITAIQELASNSAGLIIRQIDFLDVSISISHDSESGLSAIIIYRQNLGVSYGPMFGDSMCRHFLSLFLAQFSQNRPFQSHVNMSIFNGFQAKVKDGLQKTLVKTLDHYLRGNSSTLSKIIDRAMLFCGETCLWSSSSMSNSVSSSSNSMSRTAATGSRDLLLAAEVDALLSKCHDYLSLRYGSATHCSDLMTTTKSSKRTVWIRVFPGGAVSLVLTFFVTNENTSSNIKALVDRLIERLSNVALGDSSIPTQRE